jgi:hypothetical protein
MVEEHALADHRARVDFDARQEAPNVRDKTPQPFEAMGPAPVRAPVQHQGVQARVAGQRLPGVARGRVAVQNGFDVGSKA